MSEEVLPQMSRDLLNESEFAFISIESSQDNAIGRAKDDAKSGANARLGDTM